MHNVLYAEQSQSRWAACVMALDHSNHYTEKTMKWSSCTDLCRNRMIFLLSNTSLAKKEEMKSISLSNGWLLWHFYDSGRSVFGISLNLRLPNAFALWKGIPGTVIQWSLHYQAIPAVPAVQCSLIIYQEYSILNPSLRILIAALTSLSWCVPHEGQSHSRTFRSFVMGLISPQHEHVWELGKNVPTGMIRRP